MVSRGLAAAAAAAVLLLGALSAADADTGGFSDKPCLAFLHQPRSAGLPIAMQALIGTWHAHHHCWQNTYSFRHACTTWKRYNDANYYWGDNGIGP
jgi:hypothetical protein